MVSTPKKKASENAPCRAFAIAASMSLGQIAQRVSQLLTSISDTPNEWRFSTQPGRSTAHSLIARLAAGLRR
jgi:hypothetical protein